MIKQQEYDEVINKFNSNNSCKRKHSTLETEPCFPWTSDLVRGQVSLDLTPYQIGHLKAGNSNPIDNVRNSRKHRQETEGLTFKNMTKQLINLMVITLANENTVLLRLSLASLGLRIW